MKARFLFPYRSRLVGSICILAYIPVMVIKKIMHGGYSHQTPAMNFADSSGLLNSEHIFAAIGIILVMGGLLLIAFSKEKIEDEQLLQLRLDSLQWAIYFNYFILIISAIFFNAFQFRAIVLFNLWSPLIVFIVRFRWKIYQLNRSLKEIQL